MLQESKIYNIIYNGNKLKKGNPAQVSSKNMITFRRKHTHTIWDTRTHTHTNINSVHLISEEWGVPS